MRNIFRSGPASLAALAAAVIILNLPASAGATTTISANLDISAEVQSTCAVTTLPVAFGQVLPPLLSATSPKTVNAPGGNVTVTCNSYATTKLAFDGGQNWAAGAGTQGRQMTSAPSNGFPNPAPISYSLFQDPQYSLPILSLLGGAPGNVLTGINGAPISIPIFATAILPSLQAPGFYSDSVVVSVTF